MTPDRDPARRPAPGQPGTLFQQLAAASIFHGLTGGRDQRWRDAQLMARMIDVATIRPGREKP
jgi:hypothetical protein